MGLVIPKQAITRKKESSQCKNCGAEKIGSICKYCGTTNREVFIENHLVMDRLKILTVNEKREMNKIPPIEQEGKFNAKEKREILRSLLIFLSTLFLVMGLAMILKYAGLM